MKKFYLVIFFISVFSTVQSQRIIRDFTPEIGLVTIYSLDDSNPLCSMANVAVNARIKNTYLGVYYQNKYLINELNFANGILVMPSNYGGFSLAASVFGSNNFQQSKVSFGYGRYVGKSVELGIGFHYLKITIPDYLNASVFTNEIGLIVHLSKKISGGIAIFNPVGTRFKSLPGNKLSSRFRGGLGYQSSDRLLLNIEVIKEESSQLKYYPGFYYNFNQKFYFSASFCFPESKILMTAGLGLNNCKLNVTIEHHPTLGISPGVICVFDLNKKIEK